MKICLVGGRGNMAGRYRAILKMLGHETVSWDLDEKPDLDTVDRFIVCTPTVTHYNVLMEILTIRKPVLCEKPVTKNMEELEAIGTRAKLYGTPFQMVMQYIFLVDPSKTGPSHYDFFKHGPDGIPWDMMQCVALAKEDVTLGEESPIWDCVINGERLNIAAMDFAYIEMIKYWLADPTAQPWEFIYKAHKKVHDYAAEKDPDSNPSPVHFV